METVIPWLRNLTWLEAALLLLWQNALIFLLALLAGAWFRRRFRHRPVSHASSPVTRFEIALAIIAVLQNAAITFAGWWLWRIGIIRFREDTGWRAWLDVIVLLLVMDAAMYALHRAAHLPWLYPIMHRTHHRFERVRPLTLFLLNPIENLGFGLLWLAVISIYPASWLGMSVYLVLNVVYGTIGHLGVEPLPDASQQMLILNQLTTSTFHARHHQDVQYNFGFYTTLWDRLFKTLSPTHHTDFGRLPS